MLTYILRKAFYGLSVLAGVVTLVFFLFSFVPDPARELAGQSESEEIVESIRKKLNLDLPKGKRFLLFLNDLSPISYHGSSEEDRSYIQDLEKHSTTLFTGENGSLVLKSPYLGRSYITERPVSEILSSSLPGTFLLAIVAMTFAFIIGVVLGIWSALNEGGFIDRVVQFASTIGMSGPSFFMAIIIAWLGGYVLFERMTLSLWPVLIPLGVFVYSCFIRKKSAGPKWYLYGVGAGVMVWIISFSISWLPSLGIPLGGIGLPMSGSLYEVDVWKGSVLAPKNLILPAITLGIRPLAVISQLMRNSTLEVMQQEYIRTAIAKGLPKTYMIRKHVVRNALNPVITASSGWLASMLAGAVFVEYVFGWKGLGMEVFRSLEKNDLPVVMGAVIIIAVIFVIINTMVDILYGWIDPRARVS